jgi:histidyl-tRNA synthetase
LRILDSKDSTDRAICAAAPSVDDYLTSEAGDFFAAVVAGIEAAGVPWKRNAKLVRGLDYYRHTAFEFVTDRLGAQGTVIAGGRYDGLIESLGGPHTPAIGWAAGIERLAMMIDAPQADVVDVAIVVENDRTALCASTVAEHLRSKGLSAELYATGSPRKRRDRAIKKGAEEILTLDVQANQVTTRLSSAFEHKAEKALSDFKWPEPAPE